MLGGARPAQLHLPLNADRSESRPLIVLLHGYSSNAAEADAYFQFSQRIDEGGFGLILPDGTIDGIWNQFWNATPECCDLFQSGVDDVAYLASLIDEARRHAAFDQVFAVGHSNGGFMSYRLACEGIPGLRGIVSLAGGAYSNPDDCRVPTPLSVLQIHGTQDNLVLYEGGRLPTHPDPDRRPVPSAWESVARWGERAGCDIDAVEALPPIDTDSAVDGNETTVQRLLHGCADGVKAELWTIESGGHIPLVWGTQFTASILLWIDSIYRAELDVPTLAAADITVRQIGGERSRCDAPPISVLQIHGDQDSFIPYSGAVRENGTVAFPGAG